MEKKFKTQLAGSFILLCVSLTLMHVISSCKNESVYFNSKAEVISIPVGGNSWVPNNVNRTSNVINEKAVSNWTCKKDTINTYFHTDTIGELRIALVAKVTSGKSKISVSLANKTKSLSISNTTYDTIYVGKYSVESSGYQCVSIVGLKKTSDTFIEFTDILISGEAVSAETNYVRDDFYWGKRGPSVHLSYTLPNGVEEVEWFYNEITVPKGEDVLGSYFMANGFGQGYFGIQVNSNTERRILFSVWSPFHTDNPKEIPDDQKIILLKKGEDVYTGEFGDEGSGGQSYLKYNWKAGNTYRFLLKGTPVGNNSSIFTAYFYAPEYGEWQLIASFKRPKTNTYLTRLHSFLENFYTETGFIGRQVFYTNQWVCTSTGEWYELNEAKFTADATARKDARLDYAGGTYGNAFYLKNCGFFNDRTNIGSFFTRDKSNTKPTINFSEIE